MTDSKCWIISPLGEIILRDDLTVLFWNQRLESWTKISKKEIEGKKITEIYPDILKPPQIAKHVQKAFDEGIHVELPAQVHNFFIPIPSPFRGMRFQETTITRLKIPEKEKKWILVTIHDVTNLLHNLHEYRAIRKQAMQELMNRKKAEDNYKALLHAIPDIVYEIDRDGKFAFISNAVTELGYAPQNLTGQHLHEIVHPDDRKLVDDLIKPPSSEEIVPVEPAEIPESTEEPAPLEIIRNVIVRMQLKEEKSPPDNAYYAEINSSIKLSRSTDGKNMIFAGSTGIMRDITKRRKAEKVIAETTKALQHQTWGLKKANEAIKILYKELETQNTKLRELDMLKSEFISTVSHELRTPLSITKEGVCLVLDGIPGTINKDQKDVLAIARDNIDRLARIISDLLDISKMEAGKMRIRRDLVDITQLVKDVAVSFEAKVKTRDLELSINAPDNKLNIYIDADRIFQVFVNLVGNSLKFTEKGSIEISVLERKSEIECMVSDTGKGISKEDLSQVFDKFQQFGREEGPGDRGTGLGLPITKGIIEAHRGRISIDSALGKGTKFMFILPKYDTKTLFREYISQEIERSTKKDSKVSVIIISLIGYDKIKETSDLGESGSPIKDMKDILNNSLRREGDIAVTGENEIFALLADCNKIGVLNASERLKDLLEKYLSRYKLSDRIQLRFGCATHPDDSDNNAELIKIARTV